MGDDVMVGLGAIVVLGVGMQWLARRVGVPAILLLIASGLVAGPWLGIIDPDAIFGDSLFTVVSMAVALLLFEGGLGLDLAELRERGPRPVVQLVTIGVLVTWVSVAAIAVPLFDLPLDLAVLLGALLVVSGPTVVGPLLRVARPRQPTATILRWEGIVIDPVGATLALVVLKVVTSDNDPVVELVLTALVGTLVGLAAAALLVVALRAFAVPDDLESAVTLMMVIGAYVVGESAFEEGGLFAATIFGVALANQSWVQVRRIAAFGHDVGVLVLGSLFVVLAARVAPEDFRGVVAPSLVLVVVLVLVVRPLVGWICTMGARMGGRDRAFVGGLAPRGIVAAATSSLFALRLDDAGLADGHIEAIVFTVIVGTCLVYGLGAAPLARALGVAEPEPEGVLLVGAQPWVLALADALARIGVPVTVVATGQYQLAREVHPWTVLTVPVLDPSVPEALRDVRSAVLASLDDEHNALAVTRCLDVLPRRDVYLLPASDDPDQALQVGVGDHPGGRPGLREGSDADLDEELRELEDLADLEQVIPPTEAAPAAAWARRPFAPGTTQQAVADAHELGPIRVVDDPTGIGPDTLVLAVRGADGSLDLAPRDRALPPGAVAVVAGPALGAGSD